jgi:hypothetical protein
MPIMFAHGGLSPIILLLAGWFVGNVVGIVSLAMSFTGERHSTSTLVRALFATAAGLILTVAAGWPKSLDWVYPASWCPLLFGVISLIRWKRKKA